MHDSPLLDLAVQRGGAPSPLAPRILRAAAGAVENRLPHPALRGRKLASSDAAGFRPGIGVGRCGRWKARQHGKPCRCRARDNRNPVRGRPGRQGGGEGRMTHDAG